MSYHLRPETQAKLEAHAAVLGMSADEYLEALLERQLPPEPVASEFTGGQFQKEHGFWVYRTGEPMSASLPEDTLDTIRREREANFVEDISR